MSAVFFDRLTQQPGKRVLLRTLRTIWLATYPEQIETPDRDDKLLTALRMGEAHA